MRKKIGLMNLDKNKLRKQNGYLNKIVHKCIFD